MHSCMMLLQDGDHTQTDNCRDI